MLSRLRLGVSIFDIVYLAMEKWPCPANEGGAEAIAAPSLGGNSGVSAAMRKVVFGVSRLDPL